MLGAHFVRMFKFLNLQPEIFGMGINDLSLRIVNLKKKRNGFNLVSFNEVMIKPGIVKEGVIQDVAALAKIIKFAYNTVKGKKLNTKYVAVSLPEEKSFSQVIQMPKMTTEELRSAGTRLEFYLLSIEPDKCRHPQWRKAKTGWGMRAK